MDSGHWLDSVQRIDSWYYDEALTVPIATRFGPLSRRQGLILRWETDKGILHSEAAPFPGLNADTVDHCAVALGIHIGRTKQRPQLSQLTPAVSLAIGSVLMQLDPVNAHPVTQTAPITVCGLLSENSPITDALLQHPCIKVKLSGLSIQDNSQRIRDLCDRLPPTIALRLDCAGQWNRQQLQQLLATIPTERIDYIEDPFSQLSDYSEWSAYFDVPFALDVMADKWQPDWALSGLAALVVKPLAMGLARACEQITAATDQQIPVVLSSVYESSVQLNFYAWLAQRCHLSAAQGLDTAQYWQNDIGERPLLVANNRPLIQTDDLEYRGRLL